ncbi:hypothetical protein BGX38DRAFT_1157587 [Terfezia claveryi]|nr:hypothetical protein BGX38DRAFT_1157587 [Terfezia claveryi]
MRKQDQFIRDFTCGKKKKNVTLVIMHGSGWVKNKCIYSPMNIGFITIRFPFAGLFLAEGFCERLLFHNVYQRSLFHLVNYCACLSIHSSDVPAPLPPQLLTITRTIMAIVSTTIPPSLWTSSGLPSLLWKKQSSPAVKMATINSTSATTMTTTPGG